MSGSALADTINYNNNPSQLQIDPVDSAQLSLFPGSLTDNTVTLNSGAIPGSVYGGVSAADGDITVSGNTVTLNGGTIDYNTYGGYAGLDLIVIGANATKIREANDNSLFFSGGTVSGQLYGGYAYLSIQGTNSGINIYLSSVTARDNSVTIGNGLTVSDGLTGGYAALIIHRTYGSTASMTGNVRESNANASGNNVTLGDGVSVYGNLYGGYAAVSEQVGYVNNTVSAYAHVQTNTAAANADDNHVIIGAGADIYGELSGGYVVLNLQGGHADGGPIGAGGSNANARAENSTFSANDNSITFNGGDVHDNLYGGHAVLNIQGGDAVGASGGAQVFAYANSTIFSANDNRIIFNNGNVTGSFYGGHVTLNLHTATASAISYAVAAAWANGTITSATGNSVTLNGSNVADNLYGGYAVMNLEGGTATVTDSTVEAYAYVVAATLSANDNDVILNDSNVAGNLYGGYAAMSLEGGTANATIDIAQAFASIGSSSISANDNSVILNSGSVTGNLYGGYAALKLQGGTATASNTTIAGAYSYRDNISASNNNVSFNGILGNGNIYGGYILFDITSNDIVDIDGSVATATDNTVIIGENTTLNAANSLYGGCLNYNSTYTPSYYDVFTGNSLNISGKHTINGIYNFENLSFTLPAGFTPSDILVTATNNVDLDEYNTGPGTTVTEINSTGILTVGNTYTLISSGGSFNGTILNINNEADGSYNTGFISGTYEWVDVDIYGNILTATLKGMSGGALNPETSAIGEGIAAGLAFLGQAADLRSDLYFLPEGYRFIPFAKMVYGRQYITTGSSVTVKGFSSIAGLALNTNFDNGSQLVVGAFIEGGWGDYNSRNSYINAAVVNGKGDTEYYGGGLLARYATAAGLYGEGTFAAGKTETDFKTRDFTPGTITKYDYSVPYYSAHLAVGQILSLTDMLKLDVYGKYLWTRQTGDNVTIDGSRFKFKDADSHRLRAGGKLQADVSAQFKPYVGAAYEYEFSGKTKGNLYGMHLDEPSLRGSTGIGELGLVWSPNATGNLKVDLGVQGYAGKREGVSGGLTIMMSF